VREPRTFWPHGGLLDMDNQPKPAYRGRGIGSELLRHVQAWAKAQDLEFLIVWPSEASESYYARAGFTPTEAVVYAVRPYVN
jgi:GNAT superfamily N-acetyltransferase